MDLTTSLRPPSSKAAHGLPPPFKSGERLLAEEISKFYGDPLGFVRFAYPWGKPGTSLANAVGPDKWQVEELERIGAEVRKRRFDGKTPVKPLLVAISSGHGIGKSTIVAWLVDWIMSTRPGSKGTVTANTFVQLSTKTWAAIRKWTALCITARWFTVTGDQMYRTTDKANWFCSAQSCKEENSESFAGQHAADATSFYIFDEASAIPDGIWTVAMGGLTDGEPMFFCFGNPTRNSGYFHAACFGVERDRWMSKSIDSRECALTNKELLAEWVETYGEDSDFVRVRVRGLPPRASEAQFISQQLVWDAQKRQGTPLADEPLICGLDASGGGSAWWVFRFRRGIDARTVAPVRLPGETPRESVITQAAQILSDKDPARKVTMLFVDSAFGSPIVERLHVLGFRNAVEVNFGGDSPDAHQENKRAYMWNKGKEWLVRGLLPKNDARLESDLTAPGYHLNKRQRLVLESKESMQKRNVPSPDDGDALMLTFAQPVAPPQKERAPVIKPVSAWG